MFPSCKTQDVIFSSIHLPPGVKYGPQQERKGRRKLTYDATSRRSPNTATRHSRRFLMQHQTLQDAAGQKAGGGERAEGGRQGRNDSLPLTESLAQRRNTGQHTTTQHKQGRLIKHLATPLCFRSSKPRQRSLVIKLTDARHQTCLLFIHPPSF